VLKWKYNTTTTCSGNGADYTGVTTTRTETTQTNNGKYVCIYVEDTAGNTGTLASAYPINIDITPPSTAPTCTASQYFSGSISITCSPGAGGTSVRYTS